MGFFSSITNVVTEASNDLFSKVQDVSANISVLSNNIENLASDAYNGVTNAIGQLNSAASDIQNLAGTSMDFSSITSSPLLVDVTKSAGVSGTTMSMPQGSNLRLTNPLTQYASFNCIFTLGALTSNSTNNPTTTYRANGPDITVLRSGGGGFENRIRTAYENNGNMEYYLDNFTMNSVVAPNSKTGITTGTTLEFEITEPYSMGLFLQSLQLAAIKCNHANYLKAPWLLMIDFVGWDEDNRQHPMPEFRKMIPFQFTKLEFNTNENGSVYSVQGVPWNEITFSDEVQKIKTDISANGQTLHDILNNAATSIANGINIREEAFKESGATPQNDFYVISFPTNTSADAGTDSSQTGDRATTEIDTRSLQEEFIAAHGSSSGDASLIKNFKEFLEANSITTVDSNLVASLMTRAKGDINDIGRSKILKSDNDAGTIPMGLAGLSYDAERQIYARNGVELQIKSGTREFTFKQGTRIQTIIEELVLASEYGRSIIDQSNVTRDGQIPWFKIESQCYLLGDLETQRIRGTSPKVYVYNVVPYYVHASKFSAPGSAAPGIEQLKKQAVKEYNYIYTGLNHDVLDFSIDIKAGFFEALSVDLAQLSASTRKHTSATSVVQDQVAGATSNKNGEFGSNATQHTQFSFMPQSAGGSSFETVETSIARMFHNTITNSDVDMMVVDMKIWGDPYFLPDSGMGNYNAADSNIAITINSDYSINYQRKEVDILVNFRTPVDYNNSGTMTFPDQSSTNPVEAFTGLYQVIQVSSTIQNNEFVQELKLIRRKNQEQPESSNTANTAATTATPSETMNNTETAPEIVETLSGLESNNVTTPRTQTTSGQTTRSSQQSGAGLENVRPYYPIELDDNLYHVNTGTKVNIPRRRD